ncbi:YwqJ-related putative deaminase [Streptomyces sp. ODS28]|uniref:YwqJ-related putative deaminase n=1 Tax=Streptomyces sp. ODS28 TaxID=3136688 RepID=UPI0031EB9D12
MQHTAPPPDTEAAAPEGSAGTHAAGAGTGPDDGAEAGAPTGSPAGASDPRAAWFSAPADTAPVPRHRRDGILPAVAAALSVRGETLTCTGSKSDRPPELHPLVQDFLDTLTTEHRERWTGRCPETVLLSRHLTAAEAARAGKRSGRKQGKAPKPLTHTEAKKALKHAKLTARHIREDGDPLHGGYSPPCRSCTALLTHFGVRAVVPTQEESR